MPEAFPTQVLVKMYLQAFVGILTRLLLFEANRTGRIGMSVGGSFAGTREAYDARKEQLTSELRMLDRSLKELQRVCPHANSRGISVIVGSSSSTIMTCDDCGLVGDGGEEYRYEP